MAKAKPKKDAEYNPADRPPLKRRAGYNGPLPRAVGELTPTQCKLLGETLLNQQGDAVAKCRFLFALDVDHTQVHGLLARLRGEGGVFRCEVCKKWQLMAEAAEFFPSADPEDVCQSCDDAGDPDEGAEADRMCR